MKTADTAADVTSIIALCTHVACCDKCRDPTTLLNLHRSW